MCELFALSASAPVDIKLSLAELARHGGETGIHSDGWGVAYMEGRDARIIRDTGPAAHSPWIEFLQNTPLRSNMVVAHIRHATRGAVALANTQPFARELSGRMHVFAHNGNLAGIESHPPEGHRFQPIGDTDSELAFCRLLERYAAHELAGADQQKIFAEFACEMRQLGPANFILAANGRILAHADRRTQRPGVIAPPGLWVLERTCAADPQGELAAAGVHLGADAALAVTLLASVPLTSEPWRPLPQGTIVALADGAIQEFIAPRDRDHC